MIRFKLGEMMEKWQFVEGRRLTVSEIATATGLNRMTLSKILNQKGYGTSTETIDKLCQYFKCEVQDLMVYVETNLDEVNQKS
jgi:putative transcriptional regulator